MIGLDTMAVIGTIDRPPLDEQETVTVEDWVKVHSFRAAIDLGVWPKWSSTSVIFDNSGIAIALATIKFHTSFAPANAAMCRALMPYKFTRSILALLSSSTLAASTEFEYAAFISGVVIWLNAFDSSVLLVSCIVKMLKLMHFSTSKSFSCSP